MVERRLSPVLKFQPVPGGGDPILTWRDVEVLVLLMRGIHHEKRFDHLFCVIGVALIRLYPL